MGGGSGFDLRRRWPSQGQPAVAPEVSLLIGSHQVETELRGIRLCLTGAWHVARRWPEGWPWELELSPHVLKRMVDRRFTEGDLRRRLESVQREPKEVVVNRWVVVTRHRRRRWEIRVEPDWDARLLVVVTAYPVEERGTRCRTRIWR